MSDLFSTAGLGALRTFGGLRRASNRRLTPGPADFVGEARRSSSDSSPRIAPEGQVAAFGAGLGAEEANQTDRSGRRRTSGAADVKLAQGEAIGLDDVAPAPPMPPAVVNIGPPTSQPVDADAMLRAFNFDPHGPGEASLFAQSPSLGITAYRLGNRALEDARNRFGSISPRDTVKDAYRHALWSLMMTRAMGPDAAKFAADATEISGAGSVGARLMDLYNNNVGRKLALDPRNTGRPAEDVIMDAVRAGLLQTVPFKIKRTSN